MDRRLVLWVPTDPGMVRVCSGKVPPLCYQTAPRSNLNPVKICEVPSSRARWQPQGNHDAFPLLWVSPRKLLQTLPGRNQNDLCLFFVMWRPTFTSMRCFKVYVPTILFMENRALRHTVMQCENCLRTRFERLKNHEYQCGTLLSIHFSVA